MQGAFNPTAADTQQEEIPPTWNTQPGDFVDLNSPVLVSDPNGTISDPSGSGDKYIARFPIIDGNNLKALARLGTNAAGTARLGYDVNGTQPASDFPDIDGFSIDQPATYNANAPLAANNNPAPMPVRWIYLLQNGELHARNSQTGMIANASVTNPVIGRMAFWTDDDTCKLNVNTASEGTFWDRPWVKNSTEEIFSTNLPAQNEFQMYPGHPAKTCLSTVFGASWLWFVDTLVQLPSSSPAPGSLGQSPNYYKWRPYYDLTPRVTQGANYGSAGATQVAPTTSGIPYDNDRLYASLDEIMFKPGAAASPASSPTARQTRNVATTDADGGPVPPIPPQFLETTRFFLTASNRAPEVTLFNTPRISLWPIQADPNYRTAKDQLLAFCSTIPSVPSGTTGYPYYFQRATRDQEYLGHDHARLQRPELREPDGGHGNHAQHGHLQLSQAGIEHVCSRLGWQF